MTDESVVTVEPSEEEIPEEEAESAEPEKPAAEKTVTPNTTDLVAGEPYNFEQCQVHVSILWLPRTGDEPRMAMVGVRTHLDDPAIEILPGDEILADLPPAILEMIERVKEGMPARAMERLAKKEKVKKPSMSKTVVVTPALTAGVSPASVSKSDQLNLFSMFQEASNG